MSGALQPAMRRLSLLLDAAAFLAAIAMTARLLMVPVYAGMATSTSTSGGAATPVEVGRSLVAVNGGWVVVVLVGVTLLAGIPLILSLIAPAAQRGATWSAALLLTGFCFVAGFSVGTSFRLSALLLLLSAVLTLFMRSPAPESDGGRRGMISIAFLLLLVSAGRASAQSSDEGAPFLLLPVGANAAAMGRAVTALPGQESAYWNPAGLASLGSSRVLVGRTDIAAGRSTSVSTLLARPGVGALGVSYVLRDEGEQDNTDAYDNLLGRVNFRDHLFILSAAATAASGLDVGVNFKVVQARRSCRGNCTDVGSSSTGYAVDVGAQWSPHAGAPLRVGAMLAHLGPRFQLENASQADPLPTRVRVGVAYDLLRPLARPDLAGWVSVEVEDRPGYRGGTHFLVGSELAAGGAQAVFVRIGYAGDGDLPGGARAGLGLRWNGYDLSVAKSLTASSLDAAEPLSVSFSVAF